MRVLILLIVLMCTTTLAGQEAWDQAISAYKAENFTEAATILRTLVDDGKSSVELYYNLANAYYKGGDYGNAVLFYERGLRLSPNNTEIIDNLSIVNKQLDTKVNVIPEFFLAAYWKSFAKIWSSTIWSILQWLGLVLCVIGSYLWILKKEISTRKSGFSLLIIGGIITVISVLAGWTKYNIETNSHMAVIMSAEANLHPSPDIKSKAVQRLSEGVKVEILDQINTWKHVRLMDREEGWINEDWIEEI